MKQKRTNKSHRGRRLAAGTIIITSLLTLYFGGIAFAWLSSQSQVANSVYMPRAEISIQESEDGETFEGWADHEVEWGAEVPKFARFTNTGEASVVIRASYDQYWTMTSTSGGQTVVKYLSNLYQSDSINIPIATPNWSSSGFSSTDAWYDNGDGWYYYRGILGPGESTAAFVESVTFIDPPSSDYEGAEYELDFTVECCQYSTNPLNENQQAAWTTFGMTYGESGGVLTWSSSAP